MRIENKQNDFNQSKQNLDFMTQSLFTPNEAANILKVTPEQIRSSIRTGQLSAVNIGKGPKRPLYRITQQALNDFLNRRWQPVQAIRKKKFKRLSQVSDFFPNLK
jgi:hypothetical protein